MARHSNIFWTLPEGTPTTNGGRSHDWGTVHAAILMDIRDEIQRFNALFRCANFLEISTELRRIRRNTARRRPKSVRISDKKRAEVQG